MEDLTTVDEASLESVEGPYTLQRRHAPPAPSGPHLAIVRLQQADGSWKLDGALAKALGVDRADLRRIARSLGGGEISEEIVATAAAIHFLRTRAFEFMDEWRLVAEKAEAVIARFLAHHPQVQRPEIDHQVATLLGD